MRWTVPRTSALWARVGADRAIGLTGQAAVGSADEAWPFVDSHAGATVILRGLRPTETHYVRRRRSREVEAQPYGST